jgi:hypothetical protein
MGAWWHLRQWVYARPQVAAVGAVLLLLLVGFGGWESASHFSGNEVAQVVETVPHRVTVVKTVARTLRIRGKSGRTVSHFVTRTRTLGGATIKIRPAPVAKTVTNLQTRTVVRSRTVTHRINGTQTVTQTRTQTVQNRNAVPPGHDRPVVTVTVTRTQTVTVTVTTSKGH